MPVGARVRHDFLHSFADTRRWLLLKTEVSHRRLSHAVTQVGSYLFITGGHDGGDYTSDLLLFNLGQHLSPLSSSVGTAVSHTHTNIWVNDTMLTPDSQSRSSMSRGAHSESPLRLGDTMYPLWRTPGCLSSEDSMATMCLTMCTY